MPVIGFILRPQKRPRVLTPALSAAAAERGLSVLALDPGSSEEQWRAAGVDVLVHKVPDEPGLDARLEAWAAAAAAGAGDTVGADTPEEAAVASAVTAAAAAAAAADTCAGTEPFVAAAGAPAAAAAGSCCSAGVLLDPPAAVRRLQDRQQMLAPLAGSPLVLKQQDVSTAQHGTAQPQHSSSSIVVVSIPKQIVLQRGCSSADASQLVATARLCYPLLVKPLVSATTDSAAPAIAAAAAAADNTTSAVAELSNGSAGAAAAAAAVRAAQLSAGSTAPAAPAAAAAAAAANDGHTLGVIFTEQGLAALVDGYPQEQQQQQQQHGMELPVVLQQYVPHTALYKLYVIGPSCVLTRRKTITPAVLEAAAGAGGKQGIVILPRLSADKLTAIKAAQQQQQQQQQQELPCAAAAFHNDSASSNGSSNRGSLGTALADASVHGDPQAPPLWAVQQLAAHLRTVLGLNLFNVDIIAPSDSGDAQQQQQQQQQHRQLLVVDINYFPGYDKVPGAALLFADFLAQCAGVGGRGAPSIFFLSPTSSHSRGTPIMAHQLPHFVAGAVAGLNALGTAGTLAARPTGEPRSREAAPDPVAPPPPSAEVEGGLAGVRKAAEPISYATDGSTAVHAHPIDAAPLEGVAAARGGGGGVVDQVADLGSVVEMATAGELDSGSAVVSTHAGPVDDPYHLAAGSGSGSS